MTAILYFSRNPNPRLAVAVARHLASPVTFKWAAPLSPGQAENFRSLNPSLRLPILVEEGSAALWETDAIACRLSQMAGSNFWRVGAELPDMIRWMSWARDNFTHACDTVHFERGTKQRYGLGPEDEVLIAQGLREFHESAAILDAHLQRRDWLLDSGLSYADFRMATFLPFNDVALLPLDQYPALTAWSRRLMEIAGWADPFANLEAPELPPVRGPFIDSGHAMHTIYEAAGGSDGILRLASAWHARVLADEVVSHAFSHGFHPQHTERLAAYWVEALGGPPIYSTQYGDETSVVRKHSGNGPHDEMDQRAIACFDLALEDAGLAGDERLRKALHEYFAWTTRNTMGRYHHSEDEVPDGLHIPKWSWDGLVK
jgi:glutathione S-transferase